MALNIQNERVHCLASRLAEATGPTLTEAVTIAIRETLARKVARPGPDALRLARLGYGRFGKGVEGTRRS